MPIPDRRIFHLKDMHPQGIWGIRPSFPGLSPCPGQVAYVLLTSAPVAARSVATPALPLDLHVLSLSLAFILSQDQTLRCTYLFLFLFGICLTENTAPPPSVPAADAPYSLSSRNRTGTCALHIVPCSLSCTTSSRCCSMSMISHRLNAPSEKGRKAVQNYSQFLYWPNIFVIFFLKVINNGRHRTENSVIISYYSGVSTSSIIY